ncbi:hypothetical protein ACFO0N_07820 [Halobium salinum]|uniref:DUF7260 domain-containing protein n=1 Tax=Halobium salinum TaxID=1364940 RepID=A0ABD5PAV9_9EURY|nr:hypothetical protein [Halobium salinum]
MGGTNSVGKIPTGPDAAADGCRIVGDCAGWDPAALLAVLFWTGVLCVLVFGSLSYVPSARSLLSNERETTRRERDAFEAFADRVGGLSVRAPTAVAAGPQTLVGVGDAGGGDGGLEQVRRAYRETVMSMAHYDEEYGESLETNMAAEFSEELAAVVATGPAFSPQVQQALVAGSHEAGNERDAFLRTLDAEAEEVCDAQSILSRTDRKCAEIRSRHLELSSYAELREAWEKLDELEAACERCLADRQSSIHDGYTLGFRAGDSETFHSYLYRSLDVSYPVLADGANVLESLRETRRQVTAAASSRV